MCTSQLSYLADAISRFFIGASLMVTRNDYALELFNGDTGIMLRDEAGGCRVAF